MAPNVSRGESNLFRTPGAHPAPAAKRHIHSLRRLPVRLDRAPQRGAAFALTISAVSPPDQHLAQSHGVEAAFFLVNVTSQHLAEIAGLIEGGELRTRVGAALPLADAREAHFMLEHLRPQPKERSCLPSGQVERLKPPNYRVIGDD